MRLLDNERSLLAAGVAPLAAPCAFVIGWGMIHPLVLVVVYLVALFGFILVGLPLAVFLDRWLRLTLPGLSLAGALCGLVVFYVFRLAAALLTGSRAALTVVDEGAHYWDAIGIAGIGAAVALAFGIIAGVPLRSVNKISGKDI